MSTPPPPQPPAPRPTDTLYPDDLWRMPAPDGPYPDDEPTRKLSFLRIFLAIILVAGVGYGGYTLAKRHFSNEATIRTTWFAPYVDVTVPPIYQFQSTSSDPAEQTVLGFVVDEPGQQCTPSWGAAYTLNQADQQLAVGPRIAQMQQDGAQPIVSFGGAAHTSLAVSCPSAAALASAYQAVISRYNLTTIDLDIEGAALDDFPAEQRTSQAVASLERTATARHHQLAVWITLPVEPTGLQDNALSVISSLLSNHAILAGINVMTMDFNQSPGQGVTMLNLVEEALTATHGQLAQLATRYGITLNSAQIWQWLGATVMIGQNNISGQIFSTADAAGLTSFASHTGLRRVSMWSLNRDSQCGSSFPEIGLQSNNCSGTSQSALEFSGIFSHLSGAAPANQDAAAEVVPARPDTNPADAPYPLWSPTEQYPAGYKVVAAGEIYQAKWFNSANDPTAAVQYSYQTPWELIGPVLPGDHAPTIKGVIKDLPTWDLSTSYAAGAKVAYNGLPYVARWANRGAMPVFGGAADQSPWQPLYAIPGEPPS
jgi:chitinase